MNFFKSVFTDDPDPDQDQTTSHPESSSPSSSNPTHTHQPTTSTDENDDNGSDPNPNPTTQSAVWSFGGLIKTLQVKSDWIDTYKRDLEEFGSGLKKETEVFREVASKAVKDLPTSIEISASKAQNSLESVGQAFDSIGSSVWKSTAEIVSQGKDSLLAPDDDSYDASDGNISGSNSFNSGSYSRFEVQLRAVQCDVNTYIEGPDDVDEYKKWKSGFNLEEKSEEIEGLMKENGNVDGIYRRVVPNTVDHDEFWCRYYYRVHRLKQAENVRAKLVKRAISTEDEEELSWDVDDDDEEEEVVKKVDGSVGNVSNNAKKEENTEVSDDQDSDVKSSVSADQKVEMKEKIEGKETSNVVESASKEVLNKETSNVLESASKEVSNKEVQNEGTSKVNDDEVLKKPEEKVAYEGKTELNESGNGKDSDVSVISTQPSPEEDDMGWDEIEDIGSDDEKKVQQSGSPNRAELRKRLSAAEEDEDLSWDIEDDDDEPVKA